MNLADLLEQQIERQKRNIKKRKSNGWKEEELYAYVAGVSNSLSDLINKLYLEDLLTIAEWKKLDINLDETD